MCDLDICFSAKTYLLGDMICFTLPNVPAPRVSVISYFEISLGYFELGGCFLDFEMERSGSLLLRYGPTSYFYRYFCSFSNLLSSKLNCYEFM